MTDPSAAQIRLRSAFRYVYFAFIATIVPIALVVGLVTLGLRYAIYFNASPLYGALAFFGAAGLGLIVPLFLAVSMVVGGAILRQHREDERA